MRSLLFVPADQPAKIEKALGSGADALILDLEDSVAPDRKAAARDIARAALAAPRPATGPRLVVRVNPLDGPDIDADLAAIVPVVPHAIMLPKSRSGGDVMHLGAKLAAAEALADIADGAIGILAIATETAASLFQLGTYVGASHRLIGMAWGAEDLSADLGAETNRDESGAYAGPYLIARDLLLLGAAAAEVAPIDTVYTAYRDLDGLRAESLAARRDGFTAKMAIHPAQVPVINAVFTPSPEAIARAEKVLAAFAANPGLGVVGVDGEMLDRPHVKRAERVLARAKAAGLVTS
jgi:citrate lyase subunit beta / citryl-CoA lyase